jgi:hypothetical protein
LRLVEILSKGFLYVGEALTVFPKQLENPLGAADCAIDYIQPSAIEVRSDLVTPAPEPAGSLSIAVAYR